MTTQHHTQGGVTWAYQAPWMFETSAPGPWLKDGVGQQLFPGVHTTNDHRTPYSHPWPSKRIGICGWYAAAQQVVYPRLLSRPDGWLLVDVSLLWVFTVLPHRTRHACAVSSCCDGGSHGPALGMLGVASVKYP